MKYIIKNETKNRLRIRLDKKYMSIDEAEIFLTYLEDNCDIVKAKVFELSSGAIIHYKEDKREEILKYISLFDFKKASKEIKIYDTSYRVLAKKYKEKFVFNTLFNLTKSFLFPAPLKIAHTLYKSTKYIIKAIKCILKLEIKIEILDAIAILVSILRKEYSTASSIMFMLGFGSMLEDWTHKKSLNDLAKSMSLSIDKVWVKIDNDEILLPINEVKVGDKIIVRAGNLIPLDGKVIQGEAMVNQASFTGESIAVMKKSGSYVYAGTVLEEGELVFEVDKKEGNSRYDHIINMIENSEKLKSNTEEKASRLADKLVPYTFLTAAATYLFTRNFTKAIAVLMVDFSCALKLAMPISVLSAMKEAAKYGITIKGGKFLENIAIADCIVFDKTGTLTYANPVVEKILVDDTKDANEMLRIAACLEEHFPHSMANAVVKKAKEEGLTHEEMHSEVEYIVAHGISSMIDGKKVIIGSAHFVFEDENTKISKAYQKILDELDPKYSHLYMAIAGELVAIICIFDPLRKEQKVIKDLKKLGIANTIMMTGDNETSAKAVALQLELDSYYSQVLPEDKAKFIEAQKAEGKIVIMVGDGINDTPALSLSDCGIAINDGAFIARQVADITILAKDLNELCILKELANGLNKRIKYNYNFVLSFNSFIIFMAMFGIFSPVISSFLHNTSTIALSLSSMRDIIKKDKN